MGGEQSFSMWNWSVILLWKESNESKTNFDWYEMVDAM